MNHNEWTILSLFPLRGIGGRGGGGWTSYQIYQIFKRGRAWQDLSFYRRIAKKEGGDFFQGRAANA